MKGEKNKVIKVYDLIRGLRKNEKILEQQNNGIKEVNVDYIDDNYLTLLIEICNNVATSFDDVNMAEFSYLNSSEQEIMQTSCDFYKKLEDEEICQLNNKIVTSPTTNEPSVFDSIYCSMTKQNNIFDYQYLNHKIMHVIDFYMKKDINNKHYDAFNEVPTYTIDYLFINYLEEKGFDSEEVQKLRIKKDRELQKLAYMTKLSIMRNIMKEKGMKIAINPSLKDVKSVLTQQIMNQLMEIESGIIGYALFKEIINNKERGLSKLKQFMKETISKDKTPDFSYLGLDYDILIYYSKYIGQYSQERELKKEHKIKIK